MKPTWKTLLRDTCRHRELSEEERSTFSGYSHLQRYFPGLDRFRQPSAGQGRPASLELPSMYSIQQWVASDPKQPRRWKAMRRVHPKGGVSEADAPTESKEDSSLESATDGALESATDATLEPCEVFVKVVHLLNPIECIRERYAAPPHPLLPHPVSIWKHTVDKLHHVHNQAYVDTVANFVLSRFRELDLLPHCVLYYGSYTAISSNYSYNITDEYDTFRRHHWFWNAIRSYPSRLTLRHPLPSVKEQTYYQRLYQEITTCQLPASVASSTSSTLSASSSTSSLEELPLESKEEDTQLTEDALQEWNGDCQEMSALDESDVDTSDTDTDGSDESDASDASGISELEIFLEVPNVPVMMILQEAHEGVMDDLLDEERLDGHARGSREWEKRWSAWMFQVIATLHFLQGTISFTHNDLHTNNIVWNKTDEPYLYYQTKDKTVWRVPTYGKIFRMIDFGRSIFRLGKHPWISGDHWPNEDAGGQYNYGPFYHPKKPKVTPNFSFDLCRLSVSLLSGLFDEPPPKKKAKKGQYAKVMSEEGSWKVYETQSELYNMLWEWTVDDAGRTVFETREGEEIYEGFDLYVHIAHHVHGAIPHEQYRRPLFQSYRWTNGAPDGKKVYLLP